MRSRRLLLSSAFVLTAVVPGSALAQRRASSPAARPDASQFTLRREEGGGGDGALARQRARAGDCAGALPAFDAAIRGSIDPLLRRDRGLCHEKLGAPFPAIDDYRAYLTVRPDAPDGDTIRERLARLEESVGPATQTAREDSVQAGGSFSLGTSTSGTAAARGSNRASATLGPRPGEHDRSFDYYATEERLAEAADASPLRFGTGWALGPFLMTPRYFFNDTGSSKDPGFVIGGSLRYAWSPTLSFVSEVGYAALGTSGQASSLGGPLVFAGIEARIALDRWASNQLLLGVGPGFERYASSSRPALNIFEGRARLGFRHVFGPSVGFEFNVDGGPAYAKAEGATGSTGGVVSGALALMISF
jgi:hypothetical protein